MAGAAGASESQYDLAVSTSRACRLAFYSPRSCRDASPNGNEYAFPRALTIAFGIMMLRELFQFLPRRRSAERGRRGEAI